MNKLKKSTSYNKGSVDVNLPSSNVLETPLVTLLTIKDVSAASTLLVTVYVILYANPIVAVTDETLLDKLIDDSITVSI